MSSSSSSTFGGFEYQFKKKREYVAEEVDNEDEHGLDKSLDELVSESRRRGKSSRSERGKGWSQYSSDDESEESPRRRVVTLRLPRHVIDQLAERMGISTKGQRVRVEAVVTRRK